MKERTAPQSRCVWQQQRLPKTKLPIGVVAVGYQSLLQLVELAAQAFLEEPLVAVGGSVAVADQVADMLKALVQCDQTTPLDYSWFQAATVEPEARFQVVDQRRLSGSFQGSNCRLRSS